MDFDAENFTGDQDEQIEAEGIGVEEARKDTDDTERRVEKAESRVEEARKDTDDAERRVEKAERRVEKAENSGDNEELAKAKKDLGSCRKQLCSSQDFLSAAQHALTDILTPSGKCIKTHLDQEFRFIFYVQLRENVLEKEKNPSDILKVITEKQGMK
ncbi:hypothetical protein EMCRGX_G023292 [Ephydatia muelleri]